MYLNYELFFSSFSFLQCQIQALHLHNRNIYGTYKLMALETNAESFSREFTGVFRRINYKCRSFQNCNGWLKVVIQSCQVFTKLQCKPLDNSTESVSLERTRQQVLSQQRLMQRLNLQCTWIQPSFKDIFALLIKLHNLSIYQHFNPSDLKKKKKQKFSRLHSLYSY